MASNAPRLRILSVGGNAVSAFLSWRLQATNACDVTLVWKSGYESVAQYGISFRSARFGNERFKPRQVVPTPEDAAHLMKGSFDYVLLCIKALPDVYDIASVIESVVTPQHTCILINTSHSLGVEAYLEERFPKNVVLSLVSHMEINQLGPAEFEHQGATDLWVGPANWNPEIPVSIQADMAEALAMTLGSGHVECKVSKNIQQQQFERMVGPIAFHTASVIFETPNHADLLSLTGVRSLISDTVDEVLRIGQARGCLFSADFKERTMEDMIRPRDGNSIMYQDYISKRPMEVETYLGSPIKIAQQAGVKVPRIETLYAMLHHVNLANQKRPTSNEALSPATSQPSPFPRTTSAPPRPGMNGPMNGSNRPPMQMQGQMPGPMQGGPMQGRGSRAPSMTGVPPMRRGTSGMNGYPAQMNGMVPQRGPPPVQRRPSFDGNGNGLDQFSHLVLYDSPADGYTDGPATAYNDTPMGSPQELALRERELMIRQKELALRERELGMRGARPGPGHMARPPPSVIAGFEDEEDDGEDYFDPTAYRGPPVNPDNVDMMSITSRRNRKTPSNSQIRANPEFSGPNQRRGNPFARFGPTRSRAPSQLNGMQNIPGAHESIMNNPMLGFASDPYGAVDRSAIGRASRTNSLTAARLNEIQGGQGQAYGGFPPMNRRTSQSPADPFGPNGRGQGRPPPPQHRYPSNGAPPNGVHNGPYVPNGVPNGMPLPEVRQPTPRHPPGHGNSVAPQEVEQRAGVSNLYPPKSGPQVRSLTGSASASAGSGDSGRSANIDSENSAYSSQSSLGPRPVAGAR